MADSEQGDSSRLVLTQTEFTAQLGRVLQFSYFKEKTKKAKQYLVELPQTENIGVLCSWYTQSSSTANSTLIFSLACDGDSFLHEYQPVNSYLCTLSEPCFDWIAESENPTSKSIVVHHTDESQARLATAKHLHMNSSITLFIQLLLNSQPDTSLSSTNKTTSSSESQLYNTTSQKASNVSSSSSDQTQPDSNNWLCIGHYILTHNQKDDIIHGRQLNDNHVSVYMYLLKQRFPHIRGLQNTLLQQRLDPVIELNRKEDGMMLQIIHIQDNHWVAIQQQSEDEVLMFDSAYTEISSKTFDLISKLIHSEKNQLTVMKFLLFVIHCSLLL